MSKGDVKNSRPKNQKRSKHKEEGWAIITKAAKRHVAWRVDFMRRRTCSIVAASGRLLCSETSAEGISVASGSVGGGREVTGPPEKKGSGQGGG